MYSHKNAGEILRENLHAPAMSFDQPFYERHIAALRAQLDESTLTAAWAEGRMMSLEQIVAYALNQ
jgi:hypothetical protein